MNDKQKNIIDKKQDPDYLGESFIQFVRDNNISIEEINIVCDMKLPKMDYDSTEVFLVNELYGRISKFQKSPKHRKN